MLLCDGPRFERLIGFKSLVFGAQEVRDGVPRRVVREGNEVPSVLARCDRGRSPHIGVYLVSKVFCGWSNPYFRDW